MTTINNQDDFLRALSDNPQWREAVRAKILGDELLQLPARFNAFADRIDLFLAEQREINRHLDSSIEELKEFNREQRETNRRHDSSLEEMREFNREQRELNREQKEVNRDLIEAIRALRRQVQIMADDVGKVKGHYAREVVVDDAAGVALVGQHL